MHIIFGEHVHRLLQVNLRIHIIQNTKGLKQMSFIERCCYKSAIIRDSTSSMVFILKTGPSIILYYL